ncbi:MAG: helix-hairpin-helix domain-containing protein [Promethearchaeota archaeon]
MKLFVDNRESDSVIEIARQVAQNLGCIFKVQSLPLGDFLIINSNEAVVIERKKVNDFISSIRSNRLWQQLLNLMRTEKILDHPIKRQMLLIHGAFSEYLSTLVEINQICDLSSFWGQIVGAQQEILFVYNTPVCFIENNTDALKSFLKITIQREERGKNEKLPQGRWYRKSKRLDLPEKDQKSYVLASIPLIGDSLAKELLKNFRTVRGIATASIKRLQQVPGIGKKKAERIYAIFH